MPDKLVKNNYEVSLKFDIYKIIKIIYLSYLKKTSKLLQQTIHIERTLRRFDNNDKNIVNY